ncbi:Phosphoglycerate kinase [Paratrimastix pyriformis]|uniref:Phosphoglycerate kinase n=1 Tax=Paratrimastix pyriformis TaxID=342808 RepID=A0SNX2_9EUKA|nr:phosphoglycerate kinase [Paratrimastix pyriformis]KAJ4460568.1 Phosphoglycerate kinase [Paratrimastix pyriformis]
MNKLYYKEQDLTNKRVLMRVDYNVPLKDGQIESNTRITATLPTLRHIIAQAGAKLVLMSHLGRPDGKPKPECSLAICAEELRKLLPGVTVHFVPDCLAAAGTIESMHAGEICLLENLRYYGEEERNDAEFARKLAAYGDVFINDAFGTAHRAHASTEGVTHFFQGRCYAGDLMKRELDYLGDAVYAPVHPFVVILGGAKIADKIKVVENLVQKCDKLLIGGGMAYTFLKAQGKEIGRCLLQGDKIRMCQRLLAQYKDKIVLPVDGKYTAQVDFKNRRVPGPVVECDVDHIPADMEACDIGSRTVELFSGIIQGARTVVWNGPVGIFEIEPFNQGTQAIARAVQHATAQGAKCVIGGGDSESAIKQAKLENVGHISTGGGASLEFLEGKPMPGIASLTSKTA